MYVGLEVKRSKGECETNCCSIDTFNSHHKSRRTSLHHKTADCLTNSNYDTMDIVESDLENIDEVTHNELN